MTGPKRFILTGLPSWPELELARPPARPPVPREEAGPARHPQSIRGQARDHAVPCRGCAMKLTWNVCALCNECCGAEGADHVK